MTNAQTEEVMQSLRDLEKSFSGRFGFMAKNLRTGEVIAWNTETRFPTASVIKLPVMVEYFYQVAAGRLDPLQKVTLAPEERRGGSGLLQFFTPGAEVRLADAVLLMIVVSDNSATNLVIDALGQSHAEKLAAVNERMAALGLKNTRLLNRLMAYATKTDSSESIRYGVGVSTPADMVLLLEKLYHGELADSLSSRRMIGILQEQFYDSAIPRLLPFESAHNLVVAHKTGGVTGVSNDVGLVLSDEADFAIAAFTEQAPDRRDNADNQATLAVARAARLAWNHFTGNQGMERPFATSIDWNAFPGGEWARIFLRNAPYPHPSRQEGWHYQENFFPRDPHYIDSSAVIVIPEGFKPHQGAVDLIVHFHGWNNDDLGVLEQFHLPQQLAASHKNAILVLAQGPWHAQDSGGGKMEEEGGFRRMVEEILAVLRAERRIPGEAQLGKVIVSAHSGGYRPAIYAVSRGGLQKEISEVFLFDAFYALTEELIPWLKADKHHLLRSVYTEHLAGEHTAFKALLKENHLAWQEAPAGSMPVQPVKGKRVLLEQAPECHSCVIFHRFQRWLESSALSPR
ncbi:MAG TPA: class A beta-lactamase-related serine hydrolase [bacterium]|nr:class A beta-lactamase-related serine hydrolase [bacterium]HPR86734.1 class A beta-lactamase-related serine hydrolase [bacterium]